MKKAILFFAVFFGLVTQAQVSERVSVEYDRSVILYKTVEDFQNKTGIPTGDFYADEWSSWGKNVLYANQNGNQRKIDMNDYWGFSVGDFLFRMKKKGTRIPIAVLKNKNKVFYVEGYMVLKMIESSSNQGTSWRTKDMLYYSDTIDSEILDIYKIIQNEKENSSLADIVACIKRGKERYGYQAKFNTTYECIMNY